MTKISNVNDKKALYRKKIQRRNRFLTLVLGAGLFASAGNIIAQNAEAKERIPVMPEGYTEYYSTCNIDKDDTIYEIAEDYWVEETHSMYYFDIENYVDYIGEVNQINVNRITPYQNILIPTLVEEQNIYLQQIQNLKESIKSLDRWVQYEVQNGDTVLSLAFNGAGDTNEAYALKDEISQRNGGTNIYAGETIWIINPEIGFLKKEIVRLENLLNASLRHNNTNENNNVPTL